MTQEEMEYSQNDSNSLLRREVTILASQSGGMCVGDLERALLVSFPAEDACLWDRTGMLVGNPLDSVEGVAVALDPTIKALSAAYAAGANVLVTHHPVFIDAPTSFLPQSVVGQTSGSTIQWALRHGMSIMSFHTACDVSIEGLNVLPALLRLQPRATLDPLNDHTDKGFGRICVPDEQINLSYLAARCLAVFEAVPRVWGNPEAIINTVVTSGGSAGDFARLCIDRGIDCLICGEVKYHEALDASESGLAIIELGHDVSEMPLCALLASKVAQAGVAEDCIVVVDKQTRWFTPESTRR